jgi:membrane-associated phospholipid phosphatase
MPKINKIRLVAFFAMALTAGAINAQNLDVRILEAINPRHPDSWYWIQSSSSAYWLPAVATLGTLAWGVMKDDKYDRIMAFELFVTAGGSTIISEIIKPIVNRTRPANAYPSEIFTSSATHGPSFPSGHTTIAFSTASMLALQYKKWYVTVPAYLWAASVGYSRMYLGKHYPSDVLAGAVLGTASSYVTQWLTKRIFKNI